MVLSKLWQLPVTTAVTVPVPAAVSSKGGGAGGDSKREQRNSEWGIITTRKKAKGASERKRVSREFRESSGLRVQGLGTMHV
jgi:hypothetical protein